MTTPVFFVGAEGPITRDVMLATNSDDPQFCAWVRTAKPGDTFPDGEGCDCREQIDLSPEAIRAALNRSVGTQLLAALYANVFGYDPTTLDAITVTNAGLRCAIATYADELERELRTHERAMGVLELTRRLAAGCLSAD